MALHDLDEPAAPTPADEAGAEGRATRLFVDVANTLETAGTTGLQRVTRSLIRECAVVRAERPDSQPPTVIPVVWCAPCHGYRHLDATEQDRLRHPTPAQAPRLERVPPRLRWLVVHTRNLRARVKGALGTLRELTRRLRHVQDQPDHSTHGVALEPGDWFVDIEAAWWDQPDRAELLPALKAAGVRTGVLVADLFPVTNPEWSDRGNLANFPPWVMAHLRHDSAVLAISQFSLDQALQARRSENPDPPSRTQVVALGADFPDAPAALATKHPTSRTVQTPYLLCVSTIEPRKNYQLALDAFDLLADRIPTLSLVIVGKKGWRCQQIVKRITEHPEFESRLIWRQTVGDNELTALYRGALVTLSTSWAEGYGLSIIESMSHGTPVIASAGGAQREAGGRYAEYPDDLTAATWAEAIDRHLDAGRPSEHNRQQRELLTTFTPPTWQRSAELFLSTFTEPDPH